MRALWTCWTALGCLVAGACGPSPGGITTGGTGAADVDAAGPGSGRDARPGGGGGDEFADAAPEPNCGEQEEAIEVINNGDPPDLLIVLDRSGSMASPMNVFDITGPTRWSVMVDALKSITAAEDANIRFGLSVFPTDAECGVSAGTQVAVADTTAAPIAAWLDGASPDGNTPAHIALANALDVYRSIPENPAGRYVLFATDGEPNCGGPGHDQVSNAEVVTAVEALFDEGIHTFVLGYGAPFGLDTTNLNDAAKAGGEARPSGPPYYYEAGTADDLSAVLEAIAGGIIVPPCEYELASLPPEPDNVTVTIDGVAVPRSAAHTDGWDYAPDESHITFYGRFCAQIQSGSSTSVRFLFGCPGPVID